MSILHAEPNAQDILDALSLRIALVDDTGTIRSVNRAWLDYAHAHGADRSVIAEGANYLAVCDSAQGDDRDSALAFATGIRDVLSGRRNAFCLDYPCHEPHRACWGRGRVTPLRSSDDSQPRYVVVSHADVTARRLIEQSRDEHEAILRSVFEMPSLAIGVIELDAHDLRFVSVNQAAAQALGRSSWELSGRWATEMALPADRIKIWVEHGTRSLEQGTPRRFEYLEETPRGPRTFSTIICPIIGTQLSTARLSFVAEDITDHCRVEQENLALNAEVEMQLDRIQSLRTIDRAINSGLDLPSLLNIVLDQGLAQLDVDAAAILLRAPHRPGLEYATTRGFFDPPDPDQVDPLTDGPRATAFLERHTCAVRFGPGHDTPIPLQLEHEAFRSYWAVPIVVRGEPWGILEVGHRSTIAPDSRWLLYLETLAGQAAIAIEHATLIDNLRRANHRLLVGYEATIEGWSRAMDLRDHETEQHSLRVTEMSVRLGRELGLSRDELVQIRRGALLHDIGKVGIPDHILLKPGKLDEDEMAIVRRHPDDAFAILSPIEFLRPALDIPYCHHERWNGSGYPRGLKGSQIPLAARIFAVVDIWDALSSDRPYRAALCPAQVRSELLAISGTELDPEIVSTFLRILDRDHANAFENHPPE
ncbi:HD domain-containing phosphohydrolase [Tautonia marina]|uniref:HD domain-containing phosphohydrolase n=1 Tax=Tautonia marina TaxID=2653855 RepID=UPI0012610C9C|nr:HD domain-containing phosphohydrolase [Tautonia marina]